MKFVCPEENKALNLPDRLAGKAFRCPVCGKAHKAPELEEPVDAVESMKPESKESEVEEFSSESKPARGRARPERARRGRDAWKENKEKKKGGAGIIVAIVCVILLIVGGGVGFYFYQQSAERKAADELIASIIRKSGEEQNRGDFDASLSKVEKAEKILIKNQNLLYKEQYEKHNSAIKKIKRWNKYLSEAYVLANNSKVDLSQAVEKLEEIKGQKRVKEDEELLDKIGGIVDKTILKRAGQIAKSDGMPERVFEQMQDFSKEFFPKLSAGNKKKLEEVTEKTSEKCKKRVKENFEKELSAFDKLVEGGSVDECKTFLVDASSRLESLPEELSSDLREEFKKLSQALKKGEKVETSFKVSSSAFDLFKQAIELHEILLEAQKYEGDRSARDKLTVLLKQAGEYSTPSAKALRDTEDTIRNIITNSDKAAKIIAEQCQRNFFANFVERAYLSNPRVGFVAEDFNPGAESASLIFDGMKVTVSKSGNRRIAKAGEYRFSYSAQDLFFSRPFVHSALLAKAMTEAKVDPNEYNDWKVLENIGSPVAHLEKNGAAYCFFRGELHKTENLRNKSDKLLDDFVATAKKLHSDINNDKSISEELRQAVSPVLNGTYGKLDMRDHLNADFCRMVVYGDYLKRHVPNLGEKHLVNLEAYRTALRSLQHGIADFGFTLKDGTEVTALRDITRDLEQGNIEGGDQDQAMGGEATYQWRIVNSDGTTTFARAVPERMIQPLFLAATYKGKLQAPSAGAEPEKTEVYHITAGVVASYTKGADKLVGSASKWNTAMHFGIFDRFAHLSKFGPAGWGFAIHVPIYDSLGRPKAIITQHGILKSPVFDNIADVAERRKKQDQWLDECARILKTPGELSLFFRHFAMYALDSPVPSDNELLGSHLGSGDFHQTVYQLLDRKVAGYFIGDCDDMAEFYQNVTRRQGKLSHVLSLPGHAACGYVDKESDKDGKESYSLIILHTGPAYRFNRSTLDKAVEDGVRSFDKPDQQSHFTVEAVPFLFRFANEQTRTPYILSDRIFIDPVYAETMIRVQSYWHYRYFSTGIRTMLEMIKTDETPGNFSELGGLYTHVGLDKEAIDMYKRAITYAGNDDSIKTNMMLRIAHIMVDAKRTNEAVTQLKALQKDQMQLLAKREFQKWQSMMSLRFQIAALLLQCDRPYDAFMTLLVECNNFRQRNIPAPEMFLYTLVPIYEKMLDMDANKDKYKIDNTIPRLDAQKQVFIKRGLKQLIGFSTSKMFAPDDDFVKAIRKYRFLGIFTIANIGREAGVKKLLEDGPYPETHRKHHQRGEEVTDEDWKWFRICPSLYGNYISQYLDKDDPHYNPESALPLIDAMERAIKKGGKLGSMNFFQLNMVSVEVARAIINNDLSEIENVFKKVKKNDWTSYTDQAANSFGTHCGMLKLEDMPKWLELYHKYFIGKQHYFKIAYAAAEADHFDHALAIARATVKFFPDEKPMAEELKYMEETIKTLKKRHEERKHK